MKSQLTIFLTLLGILLIFTGRKMLMFFPKQPGLAWVLNFVLFAWMWGPFFILRAHESIFHSKTFGLVNEIGFILMGTWATFVFLWLTTDLARGAAFAAHQSLSISALNRLSGMILGISVLISILGYVQAMKGPRIKEVSIPLAHLPENLKGFSIVQISDLHVGSSIDSRYVENVVNKVLLLKPDMIAVTGDLCEGPASSLLEETEPLKKLYARTGVYYVTGNHEYYWGAEEWVNRAKELGMTPLLNENRVLAIGNSKVLVAGVTDLIGEGFIAEHKSDPLKASQSPVGADVKILLSHRPQLATDDAPLGFDLQLCGHTHNGQFFPFTLVVRLFQKFHHGLYRKGSLWVYVNIGTGFWGPPNRLGNPSEITLLRLTPSEVVR